MTSDVSGYKLDGRERVGDSMLIQYSIKLGDFVVWEKHRKIANTKENQSTQITKYGGSTEENYRIFYILSESE